MSSRCALAMGERPGQALGGARVWRPRLVVSTTWIGYLPLLIAAATAAVSVIVARAIVRDPILASHKVHLVALSVVVPWCYLVAGMIARQRAVSRRIGNLMIWVCVAWILGDLQWDLSVPLLAGVGVLLSWLWAAAVTHLALTFPYDHLPDRASRVLVVAAYVLALPIRMLWIVLGDQSQFSDAMGLHAPVGCTSCVRSLVATGVAPSGANVFSGLARLGVVVVGVGIAVVLIQRWRHGTKLQRRALGPVLLAMLLTAVLIVVPMIAEIAGAEGSSSTLPWLLSGVAAVVIPFSFLAGLLWSRLTVGAGLASMFEQLSELQDSGGVEQVLRNCLGDDSLVVAFWLPDEQRFVNQDGISVPLPEPGADRDTTTIELEGNQVAALIHDMSLSGDANYVRACGRAAVLWLERGRLEAERNARLVELRESRARLVEAGDAERRRIERDLHDGAQQRLAGMLLQTRLRRRAGAGADADLLLDDLEQGLAAALNELRALAAGILPPVLSDYGLPAAVEELASRTPLPLSVRADGIGRLSEPVEVAAYFVIAEAVANVIKHAHARTAIARISRENGTLLVEVSDDGIGGAAPTGGSGLRGLRDRVTALDGHLDVSSPAGGGTTLRAQIPCGS